MDEPTKTIFKQKFIRLVVLLNVDVMFFFLTGIVYFLLLDRVPYGILLTIIFLVLAVVLGYTVIREYRRTKKWLNEHA